MHFFSHSGVRRVAQSEYFFYLCATEAPLRAQDRAHSSVGQSSGLIIRRSWDHAPLGPRVVEGLHFLQVFFRFGRCPRGRDFDDAGRNRSAGRSPFGVIRAGSQAFVAPRTDGPRACTIAVLVCPPVSTAAAKKVLPPAVRPFCIRVSRKSAGASAA